MKLICSNEKLVTYLSGNNSLLDGKVKRIDIIDEDSSVCIKIDFEMRSSSDYQRIQVRFVGCKRYSFYYTDDYYFYNIELIKFFQGNNGLFYISLDPADQTEVVSGEDQDFILCREVYAYYDQFF
ncbi:hypothetical protein TDB9533_03232 [Thalassocella blandensis]|nr:hypothetical protein TDB9533_03232 [Thalassocella blandensis]